MPLLHIAKHNPQQNQETAGGKVEVIRCQGIRLTLKTTSSHFVNYTIGSVSLCSCPLITNIPVFGVGLRNHLLIIAFAHCLFLKVTLIYLFVA